MSLFYMTLKAQQDTNWEHLLPEGKLQNKLSLKSSDELLLILNDRHGQVVLRKEGVTHDAVSSAWPPPGK